MKLEHRRRRTNTNKGRKTLNKDFSRGQVQSIEADKENFDSAQILRNLVTRAGNIEVRKGFIKLFEQIEGTDQLFLFQKDGKDQLFGLINSPTTRDVVKYDLENYTSTVLATYPNTYGSNVFDFEELRGVLYWGCDSENLKYYDLETETVNSIANSNNHNFKFIVSDGKRIWGVRTGSTEILYFSSSDGVGAVGTFAFNTDDTIRAGIASTKSSTFTGLGAVGRYVVAFSNNKTEVHAIPDFENTDIAYFPADASTWLFELERIGIESKNAHISVGGFIYFKSNDGILHRLNPETRSHKQYSSDIIQLESIDWKNCSMGYNQADRTILISGKNTSNGDVTVLFNLETESFSFADSFSAKQWVSSAEKVYMLGEQGDILQAFEGNTDQGLSIPWTYQTQATDSGNPFEYKNLREIYAHLTIYEEATITYDVLIDRSFGSNATPSFTKKVTYPFSFDSLNNSPQPMGLGVFGGAGSIQQEEVSSETIHADLKVNQNYNRLEIRMSGASKFPLKIKGVGFSSLPTSKKVKLNNMTI